MIFYKEMDFSFIKNLETIDVGKGKKKKSYIDAIFAFDIETTTYGEKVEEQKNFMYIWQMAVKIRGKEAFAWYGRTWKDYINCMHRISAQTKSNIVIFVHNLAYEFQYLRSFVDILKIENVFLLDTREPLKFTMLKNLEYRCSYKQTNMSLLEFTRKYKVQHVKLENYDYDKLFFSDSEMTDFEKSYCENDVLGLVEALEAQNDLNGDTVASMPSTSTGYVRRDIKDNETQEMKKLVTKIYPDENVYKALVRAFRGGNTHASRYLTDEILENVNSYDRASSYPAVQLCRKYPMTKFYKVEEPNINILNHFVKTSAVLVRILMYDVHCKDDTTIPYIAIAKCSAIKNFVNDNGRILKADLLETTLTDIDYKIIINQYDYSKIEVVEMYVAEYGYLPDCFTEVVKKYFVDKTKLKNVAGQEIYYMKSKNKLNACYGMSATRPIREELGYENNDYTVSLPNIEEKLNKSKYTDFICYQWGVWCTAWARYELQRAIDLCGYQLVYVDTDSVKYIGNVDFSKLNKELEALAEERKAYADRDGKRYYMGVYEHDASYKRFKTLGAKKYVYEDEKGKLHITISGVNKIRGAEELEKIENFEEGFVFEKSAGTRSIYDDDVTFYEYEINGHVVEHTSNIIIAPVTYTLGITKDYEHIILQFSRRQQTRILETLKYYVDK